MGSYLSSAVGVVGASLLAILCGAGTALAQKTWSVGTAPKMSPQAIFVGNIGTNSPKVLGGIPVPVPLSTIILHEGQKVPLRVHVVDVDNYTEVISNVMVADTAEDKCRVLWTASVDKVLSTGEMGQTLSDEAVTLTAPNLGGQKSALINVSVKVDDIWTGKETGVFPPDNMASTRNDDENKQPTVTLRVLVLPKDKLDIAQVGDGCNASFTTIYNASMPKPKPKTAGLSDYTMKVSGGTPPFGNWNGLFVTEVTVPDPIKGNAVPADFAVAIELWQLSIPEGAGFIVGFPQATNPLFGCERPVADNVFYDTYLVFSTDSYLSANVKVNDIKTYNFIHTYAALGHDLNNGGVRNSWFSAINYTQRSGDPLPLDTLKYTEVTFFRTIIKLKK